MQLIQQYHSLLDAQHMAMILRHHGIVAHISSKHAFSMSGLVTGTFQVGLWAVLDSQYQDACAFVINPDHHITSSISEQEITALERQAEKSAKNIFSGFIIYSAIGLTCFIGLIILWMNNL